LFPGFRIPYIRGDTILRNENHSKYSISSLGLLAFSALSIADGLTTAVGLSNGLQETEALAGFLLNNFGIQGFLLFKFSIAIVVAGIALGHGERISKQSEFNRLFYFCVSVSLLFIAGVPVVNNLFQLGWV